MRARRACTRCPGAPQILFPTQKTRNLCASLCQATFSSPSSLLFLPRCRIHTCGGFCCGYGKVRERELADSVMERAEAICRKLKTPNNLNMERVVGSGDAKDVMCSTVRKLKPDILVMRSHGCGFFERALPGSVSDHCAKHDTCPVVIVKHS